MTVLWSEYADGTTYSELVMDSNGYVREWPDLTAFSTELLRQADPKWLTVDGAIVTITAANGTMRYGITSAPDRYNVVEARRIIS